MGLQMDRWTNVASCFLLSLLAAGHEGGSKSGALCHGSFRSLERCLQNDYGRLRTECKSKDEDLQACLAKDWRYLDEGSTFSRPEKGFNRLRQCRHGVMLFNPLDWYIGRSLEVYGEWGQKKVDLFSTCVRAGQVVVEVGAHVGALTLPLSHLVGPEGRVIALEPFFSSFAALAANTALNSLENVEVKQAVVADRPGKVFMDRHDLAFKQQEFFNFGSMDFHHLPIQDAGDNAQRASAAWDEYAVVTLEQLSLSQLDFVKIDAEAMEAAVVKGALPLVRKFKPLLFVEYRNPRQKDSQLLRILKKIKYECVLLRLPIFNAQNFRSEQEDIWGDAGSIVNFDLFCKHRGRDASLGSPVLELFRTAVATDVPGLRTTPTDPFEVMAALKEEDGEDEEDAKATNSEEALAPPPEDPEGAVSPPVQSPGVPSRRTRAVEEMSLDELLDSVEAGEKRSLPKHDQRPASAANGWDVEMSLDEVLKEPVNQPKAIPRSKQSPEPTLDDL